jgi:hypothetical protein
MHPDVERICNLPRDPRQPDDALDQLQARWTRRFGRGSSERTLRPVQALALDVMAREGGFVGAVGVGFGKTLIGLLASRAIDLSPRFETSVGKYDTVYFAPASNLDTVRLERDKQQSHFEVDRHTYLESYTRLSQPHEGPELLPRRDPDVIVLDEVHKVANRNSTRTARLLDYLDANPETHVVAMSGTLTNHSIDDYGHILEYALGPDSTPLPTTFELIQTWQRILDPSSSRRDHPEGYDWDRFQPLEDRFGDGRNLQAVAPVSRRKDHAREAYLERFQTTPGVVKTSKSALKASLRVDARPHLDIPEAVADALDDVDETWLLPDGEEIDDQLSFHRAQRQVLAGFYYRWDWSVEPYNGEIDREWLYARREWNQAERFLVDEGPPDIDSPYFARQAAENGTLDDRPEIMRRWHQWQEHCDKPEPPTERIWLDDYLVDAAISAAETAARPSIIWYQWRGWAKRLESKGVDVYWPDGGRSPEEDTTSQVVACSISSHARGMNLQHFGHNVVAVPPGGGTRWEQLLGRTHRPGQQADTVRCTVFLHHDVYVDAMERATENARFTRDTEGSRQKLLLADWNPTRENLLTH